VVSVGGKKRRTNIAAEQAPVPREDQTRNLLSCQREKMGD